MRYINFFLLFLTIAFFSACSGVKNSKKTLYAADYNFIVANDLGRNGYYDQKPIAFTMGELAAKSDVEFVAAAGDVHHFNGVASVNDPLWMTNYELIYDHPELMLDWYAILGNHEYRGNTQACLDYSKVSRRWVMPSRYYTMVKEVNDSTSLRLLFIDTAPLISKYRKDSVVYPDARLQSDKAQLQFIDSVLSVSKETWTVVIGHHPVYAYTKKDESERTDLQALLDPILRKHKVDFYFNGHIHNFQHIRMDGSDIDYITNSSASLSRNVAKTTGTQFCSNLAGFLFCAVENDAFTVNMVDKDGKSIYSYTRKK
ncbi:MAG: metallophosphoesterase [Paludibacter sp.]|nr:metallophosphoesterase [Paludibacter sp.]